MTPSGSPPAPPSTTANGPSQYRSENTDTEGLPFFPTGAGMFGQTSSQLNQGTQGSIAPFFGSPFFSNNQSSTPNFPSLPMSGSPSSPSSPSPAPTANTGFKPLGLIYPPNGNVTNTPAQGLPGIQPQTLPMLSPPPPSPATAPFGQQPGTPQQIGGNPNSASGAPLNNTTLNSPLFSPGMSNQSPNGQQPTSTQSPLTYNNIESNG